MKYFNYCNTPRPVPLNNAFNAFLSNLAADGTYTVNTEAVHSCYQSIPIEFRTSDIFMLAGAYKTGVIAGYDKNGNIINFGFARNATKGSDINNINSVVGINEPCLDISTYKNIVGYNVSSTISSSNVDTYNTYSAVSYDIQPHRIVVSEMKKIYAWETNHMLQLDRIRPINNGEYATFSFILTMDFNPSVFTDRSVDIDINGTGVKINLTTMDCTLLSSLADKTDIRLDVKKISVNKLFICVKCIYTNDPFEGYPRITFYKNGQEIYDGEDNSAKIILDFMSTYASSVDAYAEVLNTDITASYGDEIELIALASLAQVCILTDKGIKIINAPAGNFDINPYINNCKIRLFAIKYD